MGIMEAPCRLVTDHITSASLSTCDVSGSHSPSLCPLSTMVTKHRIFAGKTLPMAPVSTWCVKFWPGRSTRAWQCCVPCWGLSLCWGFMYPWVLPEISRLCNHSRTPWETWLKSTPGTFLFLTGHRTYCSGSQKSQCNLPEKFLPEQCHKGLQSHSGGEEVSNSYSLVFYL